MMKYKIVIKDDCVFCKRAIKELIGRKYDIQVIDVTHDQPLREAHSLKNNNWPTVPMISLCDEEGNERFIGGYTDLMNELNGPVLLVEVSTTELDDVVRIEDDFGRVE